MIKHVYCVSLACYRSHTGRYAKELRMVVVRPRLTRDAHTSVRIPLCAPARAYGRITTCCACSLVATRRHEDPVSHLRHAHATGGRPLPRQRHFAQRTDARCLKLVIPLHTLPTHADKHTLARHTPLITKLATHACDNQRTVKRRSGGCQ